MLVVTLKVFGWTTIIGGIISAFFLFDGAYAFLFMVSCLGAGIIDLGLAGAIEQGQSTSNSLYELEKWLRKTNWEGFNVKSSTPKKGKGQG